MAPAEGLRRLAAVSGLRFTSALPPTALIQPKPTVAMLGWLALGCKDQGPLGQLGPARRFLPFYLSPTFQFTQTSEIWIEDSRTQATMANKATVPFV